jgi:hypothetical protein
VLPFDTTSTGRQDFCVLGDSQSDSYRQAFPASINSSAPHDLIQQIHSLLTRARVHQARRLLGKLSCTIEDIVQALQQGYFQCSFIEGVYSKHFSQILSRIFVPSKIALLCTLNTLWVLDHTTYLLAVWRIINFLIIPSIRSTHKAILNIRQIIAQAKTTILKKCTNILSLTGRKRSLNELLLRPIHIPRYMRG